VSEGASKATYTVSSLQCDNCGWSQYIGVMKEKHPIPKGQIVKDTKCPNCGTKSLSSRRW
jgi:transcription elongation factor Elf1